MFSVRFIADAFRDHNIRYYIYSRYMNCMIACIRKANENTWNLISIVQFLIIIIIMLWFKIFPGLKCFKLVRFSFFFVDLIFIII